MTSRENFLRAFHRANPAATSRALARGGSYERLAARVPVDADRVLDLACGDGHLMRLLGGAIGIDIAIEDLHIARASQSGAVSDSESGSGSESQSGSESGSESGSVSESETSTSTSTSTPTSTISHALRAMAMVAQARAQALPFAAGSFDAITCHLAFMLFDDVEQVVSELARVLRPGGAFVALLGGGPTADGNDAFHEFASMVPRGGLALGDRRASSEAGWRELFHSRDWRDITFDRWELDLSGTFDEVWAFLGSSYQIADPRHLDQAGMPIHGTPTAALVRDPDKMHNLCRKQVGPISEALRERFPGERVPLSIATYCATAIRR